MPAVGWGFRDAIRGFCLDPKSYVDPPTHFKLGKRL